MDLNIEPLKIRHRGLMASHSLNTACSRGAPKCFGESIRAVLAVQRTEFNMPPCRLVFFPRDLCYRCCHTCQPTSKQSDQDRNAGLRRVISLVTARHDTISSEVAAKVIAASSKVIILTVFVALFVCMFFMVVNRILQHHAADETGTKTKSSTASHAHTAAALLRPLLRVVPRAAAVALLGIVSTLRRTITAIALLRRIASLLGITTVPPWIALLGISASVAARAAVLVLAAATEQLAQQAAALAALLARWELRGIRRAGSLLCGRAVHEISSRAPSALSTTAGASASVLLLLQAAREVGVALDLVR